MQIHVLRDLFAWGDTAGGWPAEFDWELVFHTSTEGDAFAPALHVSPGRMEDLLLFPFSPLDEHGLVGVLYRQADVGGAVSIYTAHSNESGDPLTWTEDPSSLSDWIVTQPYEFRQGLTAVTRCMATPECSDPGVGTSWFGVWTDERNGAGAQVFGGTYDN